MADTIIIETPVATVLEVSGKQGPQGVPGVTGSVGPKGDKGDPGTGIETLTTAGDLLYRDNSAAARLPIGSSSQILKVVNGLPAWANESGAVTSVNGQTGAVTVSVPSASSATPSALGVAAAGSSANFARADHVHAMPSAQDVGAAVNLEYLSISTPSSAPFIVNLAANKQYLVTKTTSNEVALYLPETASNGDRIIVRWFSGSVGDGLTIVRQGGNPFLQTIGRMRGPSVFFAVWAGAWRVDFVPPSGLGLAPSTPTSNGIAGDMAYADPYLYVCVANNNWRRVPVAAW